MVGSHNRTVRPRFPTPAETPDRQSSALITIIRKHLFIFEFLCLSKTRLGLPRWDTHEPSRDRRIHVQASPRCC